MCGIFGYGHYRQARTNHQILTMLVNGLKRLEYRGYDSAGVAVDAAPAAASSAATIAVVRQKGNVDSLRQACFEENRAGLDMQGTLETSVSIAHTRWATHGPPCERNAHPQSSADGEFVLCHNGIMTNYCEVKAFLVGHKYSFSSDTDTEVIANLFHYLYHSLTAGGLAVTFASLTNAVMKEVEGANAVIVKSTRFPDELVAVKRGSPLIVGIPADHVTSLGGAQHHHQPLASAIDAAEVFISSDANAIAEHTKKVVYLEDNDYIHYGGGVLTFGRVAAAGEGQDSDSSPTAIAPQISELHVALDQLSRGKYPHYMLKEIFEQPESVTNTMRGRIDFEARTVRLGGFVPFRDVLRHASRILFVSCGTSLNACLAARPLFDELVECPNAVENASDFLDRKPFVSRCDVCVFVSQSGETADTLRVLEYCRTKGAFLVGITNVVGSSISRQTDCGAHLNCGVEVGVASTKAYTSQIVALTLLALQLSEDSTRLAARRAEVVAALAALPAKISECLAAVDGPIQRIAKGFVNAKSVLVLGRGYQFATCLEAALKIKELTYVHTEGINSGELKHGPLALIDEHIPVIAISTRDAHIERARAAIQQIRARKGRPIVLVSGPDPELEEVSEELLQVPQTADCLQSVINVLPMQLLAYHLAVLRGNNVDCPRNLAKSVTVQ